MINKEQIICEISSKKIIAIARGIYGEQCINLAKALYDGGISLLEITYDQSNSQSVQDTADTLRALNSALGDKMIFGAVRDIRSAGHCCCGCRCKVYYLSQYR